MNNHASLPLSYLSRQLSVAFPTRLLALTMLLGSLNFSVQAQNVGIATPTPATKLDVNGDLALRKGADIALVNGVNNNVAIGANSFFRLTGPTADFSLTGMAGGKDGKLLTLVNTTTHTLTLSNENAASTTANRLRTSAGTDLVVVAGTAVTLVYDATAQRWQVTASSAGNAGWNLTGNAGTTPATRFLGTTDAQDLAFRTNNTEQMRLTQSGSLWLTNPNQNTFIGYQAGLSNTSGYWNHIEGYQAGLSNTSGYTNHFEGYLAGYNNTTGSANHFEGYRAGLSNTTGSNNHFEGFNAGLVNTTGNNNFFVGPSAGSSNTTGSANHFEGFQAGNNNTTGSTNLFEGFQTGSGNTTGSNNTLIGSNADVATGNLTNAAAIGFSARVSRSNSLVLGGFGPNAVNVGIGTTAPSYKLNVDPSGAGGILIGNPNTSTGNFTSLALTISDGIAGYGNIQSIASAGRDYGNLILNRDGGNVGIGTAQPAYALHVIGRVAGTSAYVNASDRRYKRNITTLTHSLNKVMQLRGVSYQWRQQEFPQLKFDDKRQLGFIAQELLEVLPEAVTQDQNGYYSVAYSEVIPVLAEAIKELKANNDAIKMENEALKARNNQLQHNQVELGNRLQQIEALVQSLPELKAQNK